MEDQTQQVAESSGLEDLKKNLKGKNLIFGTIRTIKQLREGKLAKVYLSSNTPANVEGDCTHYSKLAGAELVKLELPNNELGIFCKKPFSISVIGLMK